MNKEYFGDISSNLVLIQPVDEHDLSFIDNEITLHESMQNELMNMLEEKANE